ncbi:MAG: cation-translocating P-type ATPase [Haloarculaceae archaeon]
MARHDSPVESVLTDLDTDREGLPASVADERRRRHGENEITGDGGETALGLLLAQFESALIWVLIAAAVLSAWAGHVVDAVLIAIIVVLNGVFGFVQDYRAERSLESLREMSAPTANVRRAGETSEVPATALVPGDVIELSSGDVVPADGRVIEAEGLAVDEASLTGESQPVEKSVDPAPADAPLAERTAMVYKGTNVTSGSGVAVVTATGMETEMGAIADRLATTTETRTPLQGELDTLGRRLGLGVLVLAGVVAPVLVVRGADLVSAALTAVSLAVAAIPEGLPAVVTLTLALGVRTMANRDALVRRLPAVEALGSVDVICTDKTGTLTEGQMHASRAWVASGTVDLDAEADPELTPPLERLLAVGALCNDATAEAGDPTERALFRAAEDCGIDVATLREENPRTDEVPFAAERKWMGTVHGDVGYVKGAPAVLLEESSHLLTADGRVELTSERRAEIEDHIDAFADDALRVLGFAVDEDGSLRDGETDALDSGLTFVGILGMIDPPRSEVADAIRRTERAGIAVKMITGDNVRTAAAIASDLGIEGDVTAGRDIESMDDEELRDRVETSNVFARATPEHKVRILEALQSNDHVVAMTGDGVNDAPALKRADVGVAMGVRGTDVATQASDLVLLDDNYATITRAVELGRAIFDNVWKFVAYLLSANVAEVAIVFLASLWGYLILPAVQLLWINLLTDGLPALALGADPQGGDVMERPPRAADRGIVGREMLTLVGGTGTVTTAVMLGVTWLVLAGAAARTPYAMTMVFTGFVLLEFVKLYVIRWVRETPTLTNRWLALAVAGSLALQLAVVYSPLGAYFGTVPLGLADWGLLAGAVAVCLPAYLAVGALARRLSDTNETAVS